MDKLLFDVKTYLQENFDSSLLFLQPYPKKKEPLPTSTVPEPLKQASHAPFKEEIETIYKKIAPNLLLTESLTKNPPKVPLFFDPSLEKHLTFLTSLAKAIDHTFTPSSLFTITKFETENSWKELLVEAQFDLIIIPETLLQNSKNLLNLCKVFPKKILRQVGKTPLLSLAKIDPSPLYKKELWTLLTRFFSRSSHVRKSRS